LNQNCFFRRPKTFFNSIGQLRSFPAVGANVRFSQEQTFTAGRANDRVSPLAAVVRRLLAILLRICRYRQSYYQAFATRPAGRYPRRGLTEAEAQFDPASIF
jgi:hypothetical protein